MSKNFGFSNIYLKVGITLIVISITILIAAFVIPSTTAYVSGSLAGLFFISGVVLYAIGRIAQVRRPRA